MQNPRSFLFMMRALLLATASVSVFAALPSCSGDTPNRDRDEEEDEDEDGDTTSTSTTGVTFICNPGDTEACYSGPEGTEGVSACKGGMHTCLPTGTAYGPCEGEVVPQAETCATVEDDNCDGLTECQAVFVFRHHFGGESDVFANGVDVDDAGAVYVVGGSKVSLDFGPGSSPVGVGGFVAKFDPLGKFLWNQALPAQATDVSVDAAGNIVVAQAYCALTKLDPTGKLLWQKSQDTDCAPTGMQVETDGAGNVVLFGSFGATGGGVDLGTGVLATKGKSDVFIAKLDPDGAALFAKSFGDAQEQTAVSLAVDKVGSIHAIGNFAGMLNLGGLTLQGVAGSSAFAVKLGATGEHVWSKALTGTPFGEGFGVTADAQGNTFSAALFGKEIVYGNVTSSVDPDPRNVALLRQNAQGEYGSEELIQGETGTQASMAIGPLGGLYVTGNFTNTVDFGSFAGETLQASPYGLYIGGFDPAGDVLWAKSFTASNAASTLIIASSPSGENLALAGSFIGDIDFGDETFTSSGTGQYSDLFVARITP